MSSAGHRWVTVRVRIRKKPDVEELDGVRLDDMRPGSVREVSASIGTWLVAQRFAEPEMRSLSVYEDDFLVARHTVSDRPTDRRRRAGERR